MQLWVYLARQIKCIDNLCMIIKMNFRYPIDNNLVNVFHLVVEFLL